METDLTDLLDFWDGDKYLTYDIYWYLMISGWPGASGYSYSWMSDEQFGAPFCRISKSKWLGIGLSFTV
jgi:hypothetical protein